MAGKQKFIKIIRNENTDESVKIEATSESALKSKINAQYKKWDTVQKKWNREQDEIEREQYVEFQEKEAFYRSGIIADIIDNLNNGLLDSIRVKSSKSYYNGIMKRGEYSDICRKPSQKTVFKEAKVPKKIVIWEILSEERKKKRITAEREANALLEKYLKRYKVDEIQYQKKQDEYNYGIQQRYAAFKNGSQKEVKEFFEHEIASDCKFTEGYFIGFQLGMEVIYERGSRTLIITSRLPSIEAIPNIEGYKYDSQKDDFVDVPMKKNKFNSLYNHTICNMTLRAIAVVFEADEFDLLEVVVFNGYKTRLDRSRGKHIDDCHISVEMKKKEYEDIYIKNADGQEVFQRICKDFSNDFTMEHPPSVTPIYDNGRLNRFYL